MNKILKTILVMQLFFAESIYAIDKKKIQFEQEMPLSLLGHLRQLDTSLKKFIFAYLVRVSSGDDVIKLLFERHNVLLAEK